MGQKASTFYDVGVIGGGPAGISACLELAKQSGIKVGLFECEPELGGMPKSCHIFFGMRDLKRIYSGPLYAHKLDRLIRNTSVDIYTNATVLKVLPGKPGDFHQLTVSSSEGLKKYSCRFILLATGCYERSRESRRIPGTRSSGVFTTGSLQEIVNIQHLKPGKRAVVIGSELVAFSSIITLQRAGVSIAGLIDENPLLKSNPLVAKSFSHFYHFPLYLGYKVLSIFGDKRVEGVTLVSKEENKEFKLECDTVVCTGDFRPNASLIYNTNIEEDPFTAGPIVDINYRTTVDNIYAIGNILHGAYMHDICALEGRKAARIISKQLNKLEVQNEDLIRITSESPIRYVVPQLISIKQKKNHRSSLFTPGVSLQVSFSIKQPTIQAWSGKEIIWENSYNYLKGHSRIPIPVEKFKWHKAEPDKNIVFKIKK